MAYVIYYVFSESGDEKAESKVLMYMKKYDIIISGDSMIRKVIELSGVINVNCIKQNSDFEYAGIKGFAELIGCKIIFFRHNKNDLFYDAINFYDIEEKEVYLCNSILEKFDFPINFDSELDDIIRIFGENYLEDDIIEDCIKYNYRLKEDLFLSFTVSNRRIIGIEIVFDSRIANNRMNSV